MDFGNNRQNLLVLKFCFTVGTYEMCNHTDTGFSLNYH